MAGIISLSTETSVFIASIGCASSFSVVGKTGIADIETSVFIISSSFSFLSSSIRATGILSWELISSITSNLDSDNLKNIERKIKKIIIIKQIIS